MKAMIRWSGIGIAAVVIVLGFFLLEPLLKFVLEQAGTRALSTKVTLESVNIGWSDASLSLNGLEVADKKRTMTNTVEVDQIALQIDALEALSGHLIAEKARIAGIQFNTKRSSSGDVNDLVTLSNVDEKVSQSADSMSLPGLDLPDVSSLVSKENSLTYQRYVAFRQYVDESKASFEKRLDALKDKEKIESYKARFKEIKEAKGFMGKLKMAGEAKSLQKDIKKDLKEAKRLRKDFDQTVVEIRRRVTELENSPKEEADHLLAKVGVEGGTAQVAEMLFGPELKGYLKQISELTRSSEDTPKNEASESPIAERGKGLFVRFDAEQALPMVWFKHSELSGDLNGLGVPFGFNGEATHISDQQELTQQPTAVTLDLLSDQVKSANVGVVADLRGHKKITVEGVVNDYQVENQPLSGGFDLAKGLADLNFKVKSVDSVLSGNIDLAMTSVSLEGEGELYRSYPAAKSALANIDLVEANANLSGSLEQPEVSIRSNLDQILSNVINQALEGQIASYKKELVGELDGMLQQEMGDVGELKADFLGMSDDITDSEGLLDDILGGL